MPDPIVNQNRHCHRYKMFSANGLPAEARHHCFCKAAIDRFALIDGKTRNVDLPVTTHLNESAIHGNPPNV